MLNLHLIPTDGLSTSALFKVVFFFAPILATYRNFERHLDQLDDHLTHKN